MPGQAALAAQRVFYTVLNDGPAYHRYPDRSVSFEGFTPEMTEEDFDMELWDACYLSACAYQFGHYDPFGDGVEKDEELGKQSLDNAIREYWLWYVDEAIPRVLADAP